MSDQIISQLGFDAGDAISALKKLGKELLSLDGNLGKAAQGLTTFNPIADKSSTALKKLESDANAAANAIKNLAGATKSLPNTISAPSLTQGGGSTGGGGGAANAAAITAQIDAIRAQFKALPQDASVASKRAYESAITQAAEFAAKTNQSINSVNSTQQNLASSFTGTSNVLADKLAKVNQAFTRAFNDGSRDIRKLTIDYETFVRIVSTQAIIRTLRQITDALSTAIADAAEFQTKVGQIRTISGDLGSKEIADNARKVSDSFNIPLIESANALYQTFSNQVGSSSDSLQFFAETAKFAKGSVTEMKDAIDLGAGVLNSFGLAADRTGEVGGKLFKTIELGRVTGTELANSFGRVGPAAAQMGISLDEVLAALSTITVSGVKTSEAITQLRGIVTAFSKPTEAMTAALRSLGFENAEEALRAEHLGGVLKKLTATTDGTSASFTKLFPNVRGLNAAILIGQRETGRYADYLSQIGKAGKELNDEKARIVIETDAQKAAAELNKLKNFLTNDFGNAVLQSVAGLARLTGGTDSLITVLHGVGPILVSGAVALGVYATQVGFLTLRANLAGKSLSALSTGILAVGAAVAVGQGIGDFINASIDKPIAERKKQADDQLKVLQEANGKELELTRKVAEEKIRTGLETITKLKAQYFKDVDNAKSAYDQLEASATRSFQKIVSAREKLVEQLRQQEENARQSQIDSQSRVADLVSASEDRSFERRTRNLNDIQKSSALNERAAKFASQARRNLLASPGDTKEQERALRLFEKASDLASQSEEIGKRTGNRVLESRAAETLNNITRQQIAAERELSKIQAERQKALAKERDAQEQNVEELKKQVKIFTDNSGDFDKKGNLLSKEETEKRSKARQEAGKKIADLALSQKDLGTLDLLGIAKFANEFKSELTAKPIEVPLTFEKSIGALRAELNKALTGLNEKVPGKKDLEGVLGKELNSVDEITAGADEAKNKLVALTDQMHKVEEAGQKIAGVRNEIAGIVGDTDSPGRTPFRSFLRNTFGGGLNTPDVVRARKDFQADLLATSKNPAIQESDLSRLLNKFKTISVGLPGGGNNPGLRKDAEVLGEALVKLKEIKIAQDALANNPAASNFEKVRTEADAISVALAKLNVDPIAASADAVAKAMGSASGSTSTASANAAAFASNMNNAASAAERAAAAAARAAAAQAGGGDAEGFFNGGLVKPRYFADGGPVGQDRIPAYLAPREMVMNQQASGKFFSQLSSMNAGNRPAAATHVGDTNISFGDINVTGGSTNAQAGASIISTVRRELRRGASRSF